MPPKKTTSKKDEEIVKKTMKAKGRVASADAKTAQNPKRTDYSRGRPRRAAAIKPAVDDEEEEETKKAKITKSKKAVSKKGKKNLDEESVSEEDDENVPKKAANTKGKKKAATAQASSEEDEAEEVAVVKTKKNTVTKKGKKKAAAYTADEEDEECTSSEQEDEKVAVVNPKKKAASQKRKQKVAPQASGDGGASSTKRAKKSAGIKEEEIEPVETEKATSTARSITKSIRRTIVKGRPKVDCSTVLNAHVFEDGDLIYDVMLSQTNIGNNNNKFYIMQLLEGNHNKKKYYSVWFRWGRVGYDGQNQRLDFQTDLEKAKAAFAKKFEDKTKNSWPTAFDEFVSIPGKYTMIELDYPSEAGEEAKKEVEEEEKACKVTCTLDARVQHVISLICSLKHMERTVTDMKYDAYKNPLGKLTKHQISEGYTCLKMIEKFIISKKFEKEFVQAVNEYYTKIPHAFGFQRPEMIYTPHKLKQELELLDLLQDIEIAITRMGKESKKDDLHPYDRHYKSLGCEIQPLEDESEECKIVKEYLLNTHGSTHCMKMRPVNVFRISREDEEEQKEFMKTVGNRRLLWHGTRLSNYFGILSQGLRIAPPEAPVAGYMFGKGVYFADMSTKSGNYCYPTKREPGFLLLAEVALGDQKKMKMADYTADQHVKSGSAWGVGKTCPDPAILKTIPEDVAVPCGKAIPNPMPEAKDCSLLYNEFVVYDVRQIRLRYLVEVDFKL